MKKRGRPRSFDEERVIAHMMHVFWKKGFAATSLDDLATATKLNRPSLYGAFGSKQDMFILCMSTYAKHMAARSEAVFAKAAGLEETLAGFFDGLTESYYHSDDENGALGCFVFSNAVVQASDDAEIHAAVASVMALVEETLRNVIDRYAAGRESEAREAALDLALSTFLALGIRVRSGAPREGIAQMARRSAAAIASLVT